MRSERGRIEVVQDRFRLGNVERGRVIDALEAALRVGPRAGERASRPHPNPLPLQRERERQRRG